MSLISRLRSHRSLFVGVACIVLLGVAVWFGVSPRSKPHMRLITHTGSTRVIFVCTDDTGSYSSGIYLKGVDGADALNAVPLAAPFMRTPEVGDAAAGLCGYLFEETRNVGPSGGTLSIYDPPNPQPNGQIDWGKYCDPSTDLVLIHVVKGTAELYTTTRDKATEDKQQVGSISGLHFGH